MSNLVLLNRSFQKDISEILGVEKLDFLEHAKLRIGPFKTNDDDANNVIALLVNGHTPVTNELMSSYPKLQVISNHGVGLDHIDISSATTRGILVYNTPDVLTGATADIALALLLSSARKVVEGDAISKSSKTKVFDSYYFGSEVHGQTVGIVGFGRIGQAIGKRCALGFDMKLLYHSRGRVSEEIEKKSGNAIYYSSLEEMLSVCDFVIVAAPATPETRNMFSFAQYKAMKKTAHFINIARGSLVDQEALADALEGQQIAGAGLDVTEPEPLPRDHRLLKCPNITITPHVGSATFSTRLMMAKLAIANLKRGLNKGVASIDNDGSIEAVNKKEVDSIIKS
jgi:glyoxylate reductase